MRVERENREKEERETEPNECVGGFLENVKELARRNDDWRVLPMSVCVAVAAVGRPGAWCCYTVHIKSILMSLKFDQIVDSVTFLQYLFPKCSC